MLFDVKIYNVHVSHEYSNLQRFFTRTYKDWPMLLIYEKEVNSTPNSHMIERTSWLEPVVCDHDQIIACTISQGENILSFLSILILKYNF
jgi:hypothetical protein